MANEVKSNEAEVFTRLKGAEKSTYYRKNKEAIHGRAQHEMDAAKRKKRT